MTNPSNAIKALITYAICISLAIVVGYVLTNPLDYGTLGFLGVVILLIVSPVFIKWHYPIMVFALSCPMHMFFLKGNPMIWQVMTLLSLGIAIVERSLNGDRKFLRAPSMAWPVLFTAGMVYLTSQLTGGIGLHTLGGDIGGGRKYLDIFIGLAIYFALTSRGIPRKHVHLYIGLYYLSQAPAFIGDLFPVLPSPLNYINLFFPPSYVAPDAVFSLGITRLGAFSTTATAIMLFMLARYGLRGILLGGRLWRIPAFVALFVLMQLGGFRGVLATNVLLITVLFFIEGLHRTRLFPIVIMGLLLGGALLVPFSNKLPYTFQRAMSFLPLNWDADATLSAQDSSEWRYAIWRATWPKVPDYLLLGKGYALHADDYEMMGDNQFANSIAAKMDASNQGLAISGDYHSGPLSTLMPFGIWGAISILWIMAAGTRVVYLNFKYGDPELKNINRFLFAVYILHIGAFFFIFGGYSSDVGTFVRDAGFSIALNWGVCGLRRTASAPLLIKPLPRPAVA